ncbi:hypothetical protein THII_0246 [Thioploca ingrica]|uniref:Major facilitator superfamily (MFS) profile domain-containing protein n=1 Tax=Thioploca ingrica TaxID=40754 RepID=A0A090AAL4_9GAMM|nr:hypothetical protein THII_0246 [Thioploca ingrica]
MVISILSAFLASVPVGMNAIIFPTTMEAYGFSNTLIGIIMSAETAIAIPMCFFLPQLLTTVGLLRGFILSTFLCVPTAILLSYVSDEFRWFILVLIYGIGMFLFLVLLQIGVNSISLNKYRGLTVALFGVSISLGLATGPVILQLIELLNPSLLDHLWISKILVNVPLQLPFVVSAGISLLATIPIIFVVPFIPLYQQSQSSNLLQLIRFSPAIMFAVAVGAASHFGASSFIVLYGKHNGFSLEGASFLYTAFILGALLFDAPLGWLSDFLDRRYVVIIIIFLNMACAVYLPIAIYVNYQVWILMLIWGGVTGALYSICLAVIGERFKNELITATAAYSVMDNVGGTIGILMIGVAMDTFGVDGFPYAIMLVNILYFSFALTRYQVI